MTASKLLGSTFLLWCILNLSLILYSSAEGNEANSPQRLASLLKQLEDETFSNRIAAEKELSALEPDTGFKLFEVASKLKLGTAAKDSLNKILSTMERVKTTGANFGIFPNIYLKQEDRDGLDILAVLNKDEMDAIKLLYWENARERSALAMYRDEGGVFLGIKSANTRVRLHSILVRRDWESGRYILDAFVGSDDDASTNGGEIGIGEWMGFVPVQGRRDIVIRFQQCEVGEGENSDLSNATKKILCNLGVGSNSDPRSLVPGEFKEKLSGAIKRGDSFELRRLASAYAERNEKDIRKALEDLILLEDPIVSFDLFSAISRVDKSKCVDLIRASLLKAGRLVSMTRVFSMVFALRALENLGDKETRSVVEDAKLFSELVDFKKGITGYKWLLSFYWNHSKHRKGELYDMVRKARELNDDVFMASSLIPFSGERKSLEAIVNGMKSGDHRLKEHCLKMFVDWTSYGGSVDEPIDSLNAALDWWSRHGKELKWDDQQFEYRQE